MSPLTPQSVPSVLTVPLLNQEQDPTATDLRQIQRWASWVPRTVIVSNGARTVIIGSNPPRFIEPLQTVGTFAGTPVSGILTIPVTGYSYGYTPIVCPGDSVGPLGMTAVVFASSTKTSLAVACYTTTGAAMTTGARVNYMLMGA